MTRQLRALLTEAAPNKRLQNREKLFTAIREVAADPLRALFFASDRPEPFAALHALADDGF